jgi:hypothetical protein
VVSSSCCISILEFHLILRKSPKHDCGHSFAKSVFFRTTALGSKRLWSKVGTTFVKEFVEKTMFTPIDALSLFDKVLLHEVISRKLCHIMHC